MSASLYLNVTLMINLLVFRTSESNQNNHCERSKWVIYDFLWLDYYLIPELQNMMPILLHFNCQYLPVNESPFSVHQIELFIETRPCFSYSSGVTKHGDSTLQFGEITPRNSSRWLVVDTDFKTSRAPVNKLDAEMLNNQEYIFRSGKS